MRIIHLKSSAPPVDETVTNFNMKLGDPRS